MEFRETKEVFENAIKRGLKNVEDYMYMYSINGRDYFKERDTRNYISFKIEAKE